VSRFCHIVVPAAALFICGLFVLVLPARGQDAGPERGDPSDAEWDPRWTWEADVGFGYGVDISSEATFLGDVRFVGIAPRVGRPVGDRFLEGGWAEGGIRVLVEVPVWVSLEPQRGYAAGATLLGRYTLAAPAWMRPFAEIGAGPIYLDFDNDRSQADGFSFTLQTGLGVMVPLGSRWAVAPRIHLHHISNAGLRRPNPGINDVLVSFGVARRL